ncbi:MAG TPA: HEAT repeat domain-containing protein [Bacteroidales bacterium]|nr:HEAT repeat domain-containing protein [Bacteroidales bacterium]
MSETSPIGILTTDINLVITSWNDWLESATGISESSVKGRNLSAVIPDIEKRGLCDRFLKVLTEGSVELLTASFHRFLVRIPLKITAGRFTEMQQNVTILPLAEEGSVLGTLVTIEDVTRQLVAREDESQRLSLEKLSSNDWLIRNEAASSLSGSGKLIISEVLRKIRLEHRHPGILSSAMKIVSLSNEDITDYLIEFLNDRDHELRIYAAQMLGEKNTPAVIEALMEALDDPDTNVRYHIIEALGKLKAVQAVERLARIALERNFFTSFPAVDALRSIGDSRSARLLYPLMNDDLLGTPVLEALGEFGESDAIPLMAELINRNSPLLTGIVDAMCRMNERYYRMLGDKYFIAETASYHINKVGIKNLLEYLKMPAIRNGELKSLITVLSWIDDQQIRSSLTRYLGYAETSRQIIDAFVASGHKVVDLLISQLDEEIDVRKAAIMALGRIGSTDSVSALLPLLMDDETAVITCGALAKIGDGRAFRPLMELIGHNSPSIRRAAIAALNSIGHPEMERIIPSLFTDKNPHVRESAIRIAGYFGFPGSRVFVQQMISDMDINVRIAAIENMPFFEDERMMSALLCLCEDHNPKIREAVVRALGQTDSKQSWLILAKALNDNDEWVRYYAIKSIDNHGFVDIMDKIRDMALNDPVPFVRLASIEYLGHIGGSLSASALASLSNDPVKDIAQAAVNALGDIHHPDALPPLIALSRSYEPDIRKSALEALGRRGGIGTAEVLQWAALTEKDQSMKNSAIAGLRNIATRDSVNALLNLTSDPGNREKAINALASLPDSMIDLIAAGLEHKISHVRTAVVEILLRIHTPQASEMLSECLTNEDLNVRLAAVYALHKLGNKRHIKKILDLKESDPDPVIRKTVEDIIRTNSELI